jgi:hypothetical protein
LENSIGQTAPPLVDNTPFNRTDKPFGLYLGFEDPWGAIGSLNVADNLTEYLRLTGGVGLGEGMDIKIDMGINVLLPHKKLSPVIGLNVANDFDNDGAIYGGSPLSNGLPYNLATDWLYVYTNIGLDYQAKDGFNLGFGANISLIVISIPNSSNTFSFVVPYFNIGKFF